MAKYGKLVDGNLRIMPWNAIHSVNGVSVSLNDPAALLALGYKQIVYTHPPDVPDGYALSSRWEESDSAITQMWTLTEIPIDTTPTPEERIEALETAMLELLDMLGGALDG